MKKCFLIVLVLCFCLGGCRDDDSSVKVTFEYRKINDRYATIIGIKNISPPQPIGGINLVIPKKVPDGEFAGMEVVDIDWNLNMDYRNIKPYLNVKSITISKREGFGFSDNIFKNCNNLEFFNASADIIALGIDLFEGCENLKFVNISADILKLFDGPFFNGCKNLKTIRLDVETPPRFRYSQSNNRLYDELPNPDLKILVPKGSVEEYKKDNVWKKYADRIEAIP